MKRIFFTLLYSVVFIAGYAFDERETFAQLLQTDSVDMYTLATYPEGVRLSVFQACTQPQGITNLSDIQSKSQQQFQSLLSAYSKTEQQKVWDLVRYSGLVNKLVEAGPLSKTALDDILKEYPQSIQETGMEYALHHFELLKAINGIDNRFHLSFEETIKNYGASGQSAYRNLLNVPELITLLNNNMRMAVKLGDIYQKAPEYITQQFNLLSIEQAEQKARDLEEWKQRMRENPEAEKELQESAREYAAEQGYNESDYYETDPVVINRYVLVPYPYWCGYPWWYEYEWWYPYPYWYHWGFCHWHGQVYWYSPPSWFFVHWHFHRHPHFHRFPHLTNAYFNYYHGHHRHQTKIPVVVHQWYQENHSVLPKDFIGNDKGRVEVIRDFGKFESDYHNENKPAVQNIDRIDYLRQNADKYPSLKPSVQQQPGQKGGENYNEKWNTDQPVKKEPAYRPEPKNPEVKPNERPFNKKPEKTFEVHPQERQGEQPKINQPRQQQPYQPRPNIQPEPKFQPRQNIQPKPNIQPQPGFQPKPQVQPVPRQKIPVPQKQIQRKK